jgi:anthranilate phosphoribosyltransferase
MIEIEAKTLRVLGFKRAFVMHGLDDESKKGMDEISTLGTTHAAELAEDGSIRNHTLTPEEFGIQRARFEDVASSRDVNRDALTLLRVLAGKDTGPRCDIVCLNAAPLLYITGKAGTLKDGLRMAREAVVSGKALAKLRDWVTWQNEKPEDGLTILEEMLGQI